MFHQCHVIYLQYHPLIRVTNTCSRSGADVGLVTNSCSQTYVFILKIKHQGKNPELLVMYPLIESTDIDRLSVLCRCSDWCAVIILVPVRLGGEEVNNIYIRPIQSLFSMTNCIGIIGGKPKHSLYFVGFQGKKTPGGRCWSSRSLSSCFVCFITH